MRPAKIDLDIEHNFHTDCPVAPDTQVHVQFAGLNYDAHGMLSIPSVGRADSFCWNSKRHPMMNAVVSRYELVGAEEAQED